LFLFLYFMYLLCLLGCGFGFGLFVFGVMLLVFVLYGVAYYGSFVICDLWVFVFLVLFVIDFV